MTDFIKIELKDDQVTSLMDNLRARLADLTPVFRQVAGILHDAVEENFVQEGRPTKWKPSARATCDGGKTLQNTGRLAASITSQATGNQAMVGTNVIYAAIQNFGGTTRTHIIKPKNKKALFWPGMKHPVGSVNHPGSTIPARPFMTLTDSDWQTIRDKISDYLTK